jgi:hypothetical protein
MVAVAQAAEKYYVGFYDADNKFVGLGHVLRGPGETVRLYLVTRPAGREFEIPIPPHYRDKLYILGDEPADYLSARGTRINLVDRFGTEAKFVASVAKSNRARIETIQARHYYTVDDGTRVGTEVRSDPNLRVVDSRSGGGSTSVFDEFVDINRTAARIVPRLYKCQSWWSSVSSRLMAVPLPF